MSTRPEDARSAPATGPLVEISRVRKSYRSGEVTQLVLDDLSLSVSQGELLVLHGPSGSGKTTLLNLIGGLDVPDAGSVRSCGVDLGGASPAELTDYRAPQGRLRLPVLQPAAHAHRARERRRRRHRRGGLPPRGGAAGAGNLDRQSASHVLELLVELGRESRTTFVVVTRDTEVAAVGSRLVHLNDGRIAEERRR